MKRLPIRGERRGVTAPADDTLSIAFVEAGTSDASLAAAGSEAWLDLKTVSHHGTVKERSTRLLKTFGVRVERVGCLSFGTAAITARLESWDGRATYRLDGRTLTMAPLLVDGHATVGAVAVHTLDIEIPIAAADGPLTASINWEVSGN